MLIVLAAVSTAVAAFPQVSATPITNTFEWRSGAAGCDRVFRDGLEIKSTSVDSVAVESSLRQYRGSMQVDLTVTNHGEHRIDVLPENVEVFAIRNDGSRQQLRRRTPEDIIKHMNAGLAAYAAIQNGAVTAWGLAPNLPTHDADQKRADARVNEAKSEAEIEARRITSESLKANTISRAEQAKGAVYFEIPSRKLHDFVLAFRYADTVVEIPFAVARN